MFSDIKRGKETLVLYNGLWRSAHREREKERLGLLGFFPVLPMVGLTLPRDNDRR